MRLNGSHKRVRIGLPLASFFMTYLWLQVSASGRFNIRYLAVMWKIPKMGTIWAKLLHFGYICDWFKVRDLTSFLYLQRNKLDSQPNSSNVSIVTQLLCFYVLSDSFSWWHVPVSARFQAQAKYGSLVWFICGRRFWQIRPSEQT